MSCPGNQTDATTAFNDASYSSSAVPIGLIEETQSANNTCTITSDRGKIQLDLTAFPSGTCTLYLKVDAEPDGSSNTPPVTADSKYRAALAATMGIVNTSAYYANTTPTFSGGNDCSGSDILMGWTINDQVGAVKPHFTYYT